MTEKVVGPQGSGNDPNLPAKVIFEQVLRSIMVRAKIQGKEVFGDLYIVRDLLLSEDRSMSFEKKVQYQVASFTYYVNIVSLVDTGEGIAISGITLV